MDCVRIGRIGKEHFSTYWPTVSRHLQSYGKEWLEREDLEEVGKRLASGEWDLWAMLEEGEHLLACGICSWSGTKVKVYNIDWCGGHRVMEFLKEGLEMAERFACFAGASEVRLEGRKGWERLLEGKFGYSSKTYMKKEVKVLWKR